MGYKDIKSKQDAIRLVDEYLEEVAARHPAEVTEQLKKSVWFAVGYLEGHKK